MIEIDAKKLLLDYEPRHSDFQIEHFIVGQHVSDWARYKQCLHEIHGRMEALIDLKDQLELQKLNLNGFSLLAFISDKHRQIQKIKRKKAKRRLLKIEKDIKTVSDELSKFIEIGLDLKKDIGNIGPLNSGRRKELEANSWYQKAQRMASVDLMITGVISKNTMDMILSLPENYKIELLENIKSNVKAIAAVNVK